MRSLKFFVALAVVAASGSAQAGAQADCVTANMPADSRQQAIDSYLKGGMDQMSPPAPPVLVKLVNTCMPAGGRKDRAAVLQFSKLIASHLAVEASEVSLVRRHGLSEAGIDAAWTRLAPEHRARFGRAGKSDEASTDAMIAFAGALRPDIPKVTLEGLRGSADPDGKIRAMMPFIFDATLYGMSRGMLENDR